MKRYKIFISGVQKIPHTSYSANALYLADYAQRAGSGTIEMLRECKAQHTPEPEFVLIRNKEFRAILPRDYFTEYVLNKPGPNKRQIKSVKYVKNKGAITNQIFQDINNTTKRTASRDLSTLVSIGVFEKTGFTGKGTQYALKRFFDGSGFADGTGYGFSSGTGHRFDDGSGNG